LGRDGDGAEEEPEAGLATAWQDGRSRAGQRVSLDFRGAPLALPGESTGRSEPPPPPLLGLPDGAFSRPATGALSVPPLPALDAWSRQLPPGTGSRRPSSIPPPPIFPTVESNDALALVGGTRLTEEDGPPRLEREMVERFELGDFSGALRAAELVLGQHPDHAQAKELSAACRDKLAALYLARLGGGQRLLGRVIAASDVRWLGIDHRAGFLLSQVGERTSVEELLDVSGMPRHDALGLLAQLVDAGALEVT
jgi:hypothetical protein